MIAHHGILSEFVSTNENWQMYIEPLELYFTPNGIESNEKQQAILLSVCEPSKYRLTCSLISPSKPSNKSLVELVKNTTD